MEQPTDRIDPITILIEWENAIDVEDEWTFRAMRALEAELERTSGRMSAPAEIMYLYDETAVEERTIRDIIETVAPRLGELARLRLVPTPGLSYYKLKNYGAQLAQTDFIVMLDSDAGPQEGWLEALLKPFEDPEVMAVAGFTVLGHEDLLSRTMALTWIFDLRSEAERTMERHTLNANNCALRTAFFKENPFPDLPAFKKQCAFWLRDVEKRGYRWVRTADAMTIHAPHPGVRFLIWRAWTSGLDRDFQTYHTISATRLGRLLHAPRFAMRKAARSLRRIVTKGGEVDLPLWQAPAAIVLAWGYYGILFAGQLWAALTRSYGPLPERGKAADKETRRSSPAEIAGGTA